MNAVRFSVCIPNYNYGRFLRDAIDSVLTQSHPPFEIIVTDNCSTDDSVAIAESYGPPVRVIRNSWNIGFAPNLHKATAEARGDFLMVLPADDYMRPGALAAYAEVVRGLGEDASRAVLFSAADVVDAEGRILRGVGKEPGTFAISEVERTSEGTVVGAAAVERYESGEVLRAMLPSLTTPGIFQTMAWSRHLHERVEGFNTTHRVCPDAHFAHKLLQAGSLVVYVNRFLFANRMHETIYVGRAAKSASIDLPIDHYLLMQEYSDTELQKLGMTRADLERAFLDHFSVRPAALKLAEGHWIWGFKHLALGFALYPRAIARDARVWGLLPLFALGPIGSRIARSLYKRRSRDASHDG